MSDPNGQNRRTGGQGRPGDSWERRAADLANEVQRWLIRSSARNMRDELGDQVKKAFRGQGGSAGDVWSTATTEPADAADQPPECAWCPICRAARRMAQAQGSGGGAAATPGAAAPRDAAAGLTGAADVLFGAARDALVGIDAILSYRPGDMSADRGSGGPANGVRTDPEKEPDHEPDHRS